MSPAREDPSLHVPAPGAPSGADDDLDIGTGGLTDDGAGFHLAGLRAVLAGSDRGVDQLWIHPSRVIRGLRVAGAAPAAARITAVGAERRPTVDGAGIVERAVVARDAPLAFLEWRARDRAVTLDLSWETDLATDPARPTPIVGALRWAPMTGGLGVGVVESGEADGASPAPTPRAVFAVHPDADIRVEDVGEGEGLRVRVTARLEPGTALRLGVGAGPADTLERTARMLGRPGIAARARRGHLSRIAAEGLVLEDEHGTADRPLARAVRGLDALKADVPGVGRSFVAGYTAAGPALPCAAFRTPAAVAAARAGLAVGDVDGAADTLALLARFQDGAGRVPAEVSLSGDARAGSAADTVGFLDLAARFLAWTGDLRATRRVWPAVVRALDPGPGLREIADAPGGAAALHALVAAAEELGEDALAGRLRAELAAVPSGSGPAGPDAGGCPGGAADLAAAVGAVVDGLLGAEPDAPRGRLVLRPRPGDRRGFRVRHLSMGDAAIALEYRRVERDGGAVGVHAFALEQERGAVPVTVVFEPELPGVRVKDARVDGHPAELEPRRGAGGWAVPVQVVLDHRRSVVVELEQPVP